MIRFLSKHIISLGGISVLCVMLNRLILSVVLMDRFHARTIHDIFINNFIRWDSGWFNAIASNGYTQIIYTAFFPLYPMLTRAVHIVSTLSVNTSSVFVSTVMFAVALFYLGAIVQRIFSRRVAVISMLLYALFPTSFFLDSAYSESLFSALCLASICHALKRHFWTAGVLTALATLTRNTGILVDVILLGEYLAYREMNLKFWTMAWWKKINIKVVSLTFPIIAILGYCVWTYYRFGVFLGFLTAEKIGWSRNFMFPWQTVRGTVSNIAYWTGWLYQYYIIELATFILIVVLIVYGIRHVRTGYIHVSFLIYSLVLLWLVTTNPSMSDHDYLLSISRFSLMFFPMFIYLANIAKKLYIAIPLLCISGFCLVDLSVKFFGGTWVA